MSPFAWQTVRFSNSMKNQIFFLKSKTLTEGFARTSALATLIYPDCTKYITQAQINNQGGKTDRIFQHISFRVSGKSRMPMLGRLVIVLNITTQMLLDTQPQK